MHDRVVQEEILRHALSKKEEARGSGCGLRQLLMGLHA